MIVLLAWDRSIPGKKSAVRRRAPISRRALNGRFLAISSVLVKGRG
jgi:hypothetical protein